MSQRETTWTFPSASLTSPQQTLVSTTVWSSGKENMVTWSLSLDQALISLWAVSMAWVSFIPWSLTSQQECPSLFEQKKESGTTVIWTWSDFTPFYKSEYLRPWRLCYVLQAPQLVNVGEVWIPRLPGSTVLVFSITFSPLIPGIKEMKVWVTCCLTGQASRLISGACTLSVAESSLYSALIERLLCARPCPGCCGSSSEQSRRGLFSREAYVLFLPKRRSPSRAGRGVVFLYFLFRLSHLRF